MFKFLNSKNRAEDTFAPGMVSYLAEEEKEGYRRRIHLRIDQDETGVLWVDANEVFYLNRSASIFCWCALTGKTEEQSKKIIQQLFGKKKKQAIDDFDAFFPTIKGLMDGLIDPCSLCASGIRKVKPFSKMPSAPYRVDLALTYACNNNCAHCYNDKSRNMASLSVQEWKKVFEKLKNIGIPHVVFTGGEPTSYPGLLDVVQLAEDCGLVSGMNTNGRRLKDAAFVKALAERKLDHIQITLESDDAAIHDEMVGCKGAWEETVAGIQNAADSGIFTMTNTTLLRSNAEPEKINALFSFLKRLNVWTVGLNALIYSGRGETVGTGLDESELPELLRIAKNAARRNDQRLIWYTPTQYCRFNPAENGLGLKSCTAARYSICIEPDGAVLPCQSWYTPVGNILKDPWNKIWNERLFQSIRNGEIVPEKCKECDLVEVCRSGCPLAAQYKTDVTPQYSIPDDF